MSDKAEGMAGKPPAMADSVLAALKPARDAAAQAVQEAMEGELEGLSCEIEPAQRIADWVLAQFLAKLPPSAIVTGNPAAPRIGGAELSAALADLAEGGHG